MQYKRMPIEVESPEQMGYDKIRNNLSESSYTDAFFKNLDLTAGLHDLVLAYGPHAGHEGLRRLIAGESARSPSGNNPPSPSGDNSRSPSGPVTLSGDDVLLTIGAAGALFIIATTLLETQDQLLVIHPNYATNIETPKAIGATVKYVDLVFEDDFTLDLEKIRSLLTPNTKYISVTYPHNPTGACLSERELIELITLAKQNNTRLLVDETYRDMTFGEPLPPAASYSPHVISVSSLSKTYGLPGIRVGWIICRDPALMETFLAAKEQMYICGPVLDEEIAFRYMQHKARHLHAIQKDIRDKFGLVKEWIGQQNDFEWIEPTGGCVCFPRICRPERVDIDKFYTTLLKKYGTYTGPGHWFDMPRHYMRLGYGWPAKHQLAEGLDGMSKSIKEAVISH